MSSTVISNKKINAAFKALGLTKEQVNTFISDLKVVTKPNKRRFDRLCQAVSRLNNGTLLRYSVNVSVDDCKIFAKPEVKVGNTILSEQDSLEFVRYLLALSSGVIDLTLVKKLGSTVFACGSKFPHLQLPVTATAA